LRKRAPYIKWQIVNSPIPVLLCILCFLSVIWSIDPGTTLRRSFAFAGMIFFVLMASYHSYTTNSDKPLIIALLIGMFSSYFFVLFLPHIGVDSGDIVPSHVGLWQGVYGFKNALGQIMAILICFLFPLAFRNNFYRILLCLAVFMLLKTGSTTPLAAMLISFFMMWLVYIYKFKSILLFWLILAVIFLIFAIIYINIEYIVYE
ncbi:hypothetical protein, partial [Vibrio sp. 05-20-BW147]|uniref:hypothetical protein n=1 Tax=Vibrio sp. 05-20-BW147 TaxID=2575834 RepID=UPI001C3D08E0